jgi:hypothetical protein
VIALASKSFSLIFNKYSITMRDLFIERWKFIVSIPSINIKFDETAIHINDKNRIAFHN